VLNLVFLYTITHTYNAILV